MRILIVDDHRLFRSGLALLLSRIYGDPEVVQAGDVEQCLAELETQCDFDLALLDLAMPGMRNFAGLPAIRERLPETPIVMLSASDDKNHVLRALELGARGYILKSSSEEVLRHALSLVLSGETYIPSGAFLQAGGGWLRRKDAGSDEAAPDRIAALTGRQRDVLSHLMAGLSNKEIARELDLLESTVKAHVKVILNKLGALNRTQAAMIAVSMGWTGGRAANEPPPGQSETETLGS
ncbi:MAG: response regulator transcription factor [Rhodospirillales bacterium]|nr:response regulator transcription factor [Rhodospirillales bacterium]